MNELLAATIRNTEERVIEVRRRAEEADAGTLSLTFSLGRGAFATSVLREIVDARQPV